MGGGAGILGNQGQAAHSSIHPRHDGGGDLDAIVLAVENVYPNNADWMDYVKDDDAAQDRFHQDDVACTGAELGIDACVHGAELRRVRLPGVGTCVDLAMHDERGAFDWRCMVDGGEATFYSTGLGRGRGAKDLMSAATDDWLTNRVTLLVGGRHVDGPPPFWPGTGGKSGIPTQV